MCWKTTLNSTAIYLQEYVSNLSLKKVFIEFTIFFKVSGLQSIYFSYFLINKFSWLTFKIYLFIKCS